MARGLPGTHGGGARPGGRQGGDCRARQHDTATQEAADLLGVSRPTFVKILDEGGLSYTRPGRHRRVLLADVLDYKGARRSQRRQGLDDLTRLTEESGLYGD
ncbi:excisionase family DNA-binding protein [Streptomyces bacillaris]|uniref:excisionase family DNA-binding protein n=1 Tax=Streptomyces bacillaris TaxID=68179 RepID=UPI003460A4B6